MWDLVVDQSHQNTKENVEEQLGIRRLWIPQDVSYSAAAHQHDLQHGHMHMYKGHSFIGVIPGYLPDE